MLRRAMSQAPAVKSSAAITATPLPAGATFIEDTQGSLMVST